MPMMRPDFSKLAGCFNSRYVWFERLYFGFFPDLVDTDAYCVYYRVPLDPFGASSISWLVAAGGWN